MFHFISWSFGWVYSVVVSTFSCSTRSLVDDDPFLRSIFVNWVVQPPNSLSNGIHHHFRCLIFGANTSPKKQQILGVKYSDLLNLYTLKIIVPHFGANQFLILVEIFTKTSKF